MPNSSGGAQTITATDSGSHSASTTFTVNAAPSVNPTSGTVGTTGVTLTGTGYTAGKTVATSNVSMTTAGNLTITTQTVASNGTWSATFTVPNSSGGAQTITATDWLATVLRPPSRSPHIVRGTDQRHRRHDRRDPHRYRLHRRQHGGDEQRVHDDRRQLTITTQTVASNGTWSATFTVPNSSGGAQTITATDSGSDSASTTFTVNAALSVAPTSGTVGTTGVTLTGTGYTAGKTVATSNVSMTTAGNLTITTQTVASNGTWSATFTVPNSSGGARPSPPPTRAATVLRPPSRSPHTCPWHRPAAPSARPA